MELLANKMSKLASEASARRYAELEKRAQEYWDTNIIPRIEKAANEGRFYMYLSDDEMDKTVDIFKFLQEIGINNGFYFDGFGEIRWDVEKKRSTWHLFDFYKKF